MRATTIVTVLPLLAGACFDPDGGPGDPTVQVTVHVAGVELDELELVQSPSNYNPNQDRAYGPLTPALLARGDTQPPRADLWSLDAINLTSVPLRVTAPAPNGTYTTERVWPETEPVLFLAIGRRIGASGRAVAVAAGRLVAKDLADGNNVLELSLAAVDIEEWGVRPCVRYADGAVTTYLVINDDIDCDGFWGDTDCRPDDFCDPLATSGATADNCTCP